MVAKKNIAIERMISWEEYKDKSPELSISSIYEHIGNKSIELCTWYWKSIEGKKRMSLIVRVIAIILLIVGTTLPIFSALQDSVDNRLKFTQLGVAFLVIAGLFTVADRIFGWSSGWMRYISTVTTMENLTRAYELEWASYIASKGLPLDRSDVKVLFDLSITLEHELTKLKSEETTKWLAEFNMSISLLESLIKSQREENDKKLDIIRTNLASQATAFKADEKLNLPGAVEVSFKYQKEPKKLRIGLDSMTFDDFFGYTWSRLEVPPGQHLLSIEIVALPPQKINKVIDVQPGTIVRMEINLE